MKTILLLTILIGMVSCKSLQVKDRTEDINQRKMKPTRSGRFIECYTHITGLERKHVETMDACSAAIGRE